EGEVPVQIGGRLADQRVHLRGGLGVLGGRRLYQRRHPGRQRGEHQTFVAIHGCLHQQTPAEPARLGESCPGSRRAPVVYTRRRPPVLHLEPLETRETPSGTTWLSEHFNTTAAGALPSGWSQWRSGDGATVAVAAAAGVGATGGLTVAAAVSQTAAHAWYNAP